MRRLASLHSALLEAVQRMAVWMQTMLFLRNPAQGLVEYGLILVLIMVVCVGILTMVGRSISAVWYTKLINGIPW